MKAEAKDYFLGIDPGYGRLGYGLVAAASGNSKPHYINAGVIETSSKQSESRRLLELENELNVILSEYPISFCAIESVFFRKNLTTGVQLIQARGVILLNMEKQNIPYVPVTPTSLKKLITGSGQADKKQMEMIIGKILSVRTKQWPDDASDGLALAIYAWLSRKNSLKLKRQLP